MSTCRLNGGPTSQGCCRASVGSFLPAKYSLGVWQWSGLLEGIRLCYLFIFPCS